MTKYKIAKKSLCIPEYNIFVVFEFLKKFSFYRNTDCPPLSDVSRI